LKEIEVNPVSCVVLRVVGVVVSVVMSSVWSCHYTRHEGMRGGGRAPHVPKLEA